jgi:hypothetical protein
LRCWQEASSRSGRRVQHGAGGRLGVSDPARDSLSHLPCSRWSSPPQPWLSQVGQWGMANQDNGPPRPAAGTATRIPAAAPATRAGLAMSATRPERRSIAATMEELPTAGACATPAGRAAPVRLRHCLARTASSQTASAFASWVGRARPATKAHRTGLAERSPQSQGRRSRRCLGQKGQRAEAEPWLSRPSIISSAPASSPVGSMPNMAAPIVVT